MVGDRVIDNRNGLQTLNVDCCFNCSHSTHGYDGILACMLAYREETTTGDKVYEIVSAIKTCEKHERKRHD